MAPEMIEGVQYLFGRTDGHKLAYAHGRVKHAGVDREGRLAVRNGLPVSIVWFQGEVRLQ